MKNNCSEKMVDDWVEVVFLTEHYYKGTCYAAGDKLKVNPEMKKWLIDCGVVAPEPELSNGDTANEKK